jgi:hypothetical protein
MWAMTASHPGRARPLAPARLPAAAAALAVVAALIALLAGAPVARAAEAPAEPPAAPRDYAQPSTFDVLNLSWKGGAGNSGSSGDGLVWGGSYFLQAYLLMYEATGDRRYLNTFVAQADRILAARDSERGRRDARGRSLPAWSVGDPYTVGSVALADAAGVPVLELSSALPYAGKARVAVGAGSAPGTFRLTVWNPSRVYRKQPTDVLDDLTMDPASPDYAPARVAAAFPDSKLQLTARDLRAPGAAGGDPAPGQRRLTALRYVFPVHTGQLTYPLARFARIVRTTPGLRDDAGYAATADRYVEAARAAVAVHDEDWRETPSGEGFYVTPKGAPVRFDGVELPFNQVLSLGRTLVELAVLTGDEGYADKVRKIARWFKADLRPNAAGAYEWSYVWTKGRFFSGWTAEDGVSRYLPSHPGTRVAEDVDHGHIDIGFAVLALRELGTASGFTQDDMRRFAATFVRNIITTDARGVPTVFDRIDGRGPKGKRPNIPAAWLPLAPWDRAISDHLYADFNRRQPAATTPEVVLGTAYLNNYARRGRGGTPVAPAAGTPSATPAAPPAS